MQRWKVRKVWEYTYEIEAPTKEEAIDWGSDMAYGEDKETSNVIRMSAKRVKSQPR